MESLELVATLCHSLDVDSRYSTTTSCWIPHDGRRTVIDPSDVSITLTSGKYPGVAKWETSSETFAEQSARQRRNFHNGENRNRSTYPTARIRGISTYSHVAIRSDKKRMTRPEDSVTHNGRRTFLACAATMAA